MFLLLSKPVSYQLKQKVIITLFSTEVKYIILTRAKK